MKEREEAINYEADIKKRISELISHKKAENETTIGRLATLETAWKNVTATIDKEKSAELDVLDDEVEAIKAVKESLASNPCAGVDSSMFGIAGKVVDVKTKTVLPELTVRVLDVKAGKEKLISETKTDRFGNFFIEMSVEEIAPTGQEKHDVDFRVFIDDKTAVHSETITLKPRAGHIKQVTLQVTCKEKLKKSLDHGRRVVRTVESDEAAVFARAKNMREGYKAFGRMPETVLMRLKGLKRELSTEPPTIERPPRAVKDIPREPIAEGKALIEVPTPEKFKEQEAETSKQQVQAEKGVIKQKTAKKSKATSKKTSKKSKRK